MYSEEDMKMQMLKVNARNILERTETPCFKILSNLSLGLGEDLCRF